MTIFRVAPEMHLSDIRLQLYSQLGAQALPNSFYFLKQAGRVLSQVYLSSK